MACSIAKYTRVAFERLRKLLHRASNIIYSHSILQGRQEREKEGERDREKPVYWCYARKVVTGNQAHPAM
jgi:hypothetical protein